MRSSASCSRYITTIKQCCSSVNLQQNRTLHAILLAYLAFLLVACGGTTPTLVKKSTPTATSVPPGQLLFQANWSHGLTDWQASAEWKVVDGNLQSDASNSLSLTIPYQPITSRYAVEYSVQIMNIPRNGGYFQLVADRAPGKDGYQAYVNQLLAPGHYSFAVHPAISVIIEPIDAMDAMQQIKDYEPGSQMHTYRVEVRGATVEFYVDGQRTSAATSSQTPVLSTGPLRLQCSGVAIRISNLRIITA